MDKREKIGVILMELSKAFDTISQSSLLAKVDAYGFSRTSLKLMENCSCNKQRRISINGSFSDWAEVITEVPQGSIQNSMFLIMSMATLCILLKRLKPDKKKP